MSTVLVIRFATQHRNVLQAAIAQAAEKEVVEQHKAAMDKQLNDVRLKFRQRETEIQKQYDVSAVNSQWTDTVQ